MIGSTISHYKILEKLGEGGMGVVYKAQDAKLDRLVALKFLPEHVSVSSADLERFTQEAKAAAGLNHPNICTIHGIEETEGKNFIVMEFVDGRTLQETKTSLSVKQALDIGIQIAEGLAAAHDKGIVHRDIKPENIMIRKDGRAQIMDFGLAKLRGASRLTKEGSTVGTAGYMSPEQVQGQETDHRSDIFSLGVLLYEMLAGQPPFKGVHETAIAYEVVNVDTPPISSLKPEISPELDGIVQECLEKDPNERAQSAKQIAIDLNRFKRASSRTRVSGSYAPGPAARAGSNQEAPTFSFHWNLVPWALAAISIATALALWILPSRSSTDDQRPIRFDVPLPEGKILDLYWYGIIAISPDGGTVIIATGGGLLKRELGSTDLNIIPGTEFAGSPFFSPDGRWLGFFANGKLKKVLLSGGSPVEVTGAECPDNRGAVWTADGEIIYTPSTSTGLWRIPEGGGTPRQLTFLDTTKHERTHRWPRLLLDGKHVLFASQILDKPDSYEDATIEAVNILTGKRTVVLKKASSALVPDPGLILFSNSGILYATSFDIDKLEPTGSPIPVIADVNGNPGSGSNAYDVSENGTLVYVPGKDIGFASNVRLLDMTGRETDIGFPDGRYLEPRPSPDGKKIAVVSNASGKNDIVVFDRERRSLNKITFAGTNRTPLWTPDGKSIVYSSQPDDDAGMAYVMRISADGSGRADTIGQLAGHLYLDDMSGDGTFAIADLLVANSDIMLLRLDGSNTKTPYLATPVDEYNSALSPDGRHLAYSSNESGIYQVYVRNFPDDGGKWQISPDPAIEPRWSPDGKKLYFSSGGKMMVVDILKSTPFEKGQQRVLFEGDRRLTTGSGLTFQVTPDGKHFISLSWTYYNFTNANIAVNWLAEVHRQLDNSKR